MQISGSNFTHICNVSTKGFEKTKELLRSQNLMQVDGKTMSRAEFEAYQRRLYETAKSLIKANTQGIISSYDINFIPQRQSGADVFERSNLAFDTGALSSPLDKSVLLSAYEDAGRERFFSGVFDKEFDKPARISTPEGLKYIPKNHSMASQSTKWQNLNDYARDKWLKTAYGEVQVFFDAYGDDDKFGVGKLENNAALFGFDSNADGIVDGSDENFHKLKARTYDKDGNERIVNLSQLVSTIELKDFIAEKIINHNMRMIDEYNEKQKLSNMPNPIDKRDFDYRLTHYASNPHTLAKAEYRYQKVSKTAIKSFFEQNANKDGWVDLRRNRVFHEKSEFKNFAYAKADFSGNLSLSEFRAIVQSDKGLDENFSYAQHQKQNFTDFYRAYKAEAKRAENATSELISQLKAYGGKEAEELIKKLKEVKSPTLRAMQKEFEKVTGLKFSETNLGKVMRDFNNNPEKSASLLADSDSVIMMRLNDDGSITLKFDSGREINVTELYTDTGRLTGKNAFDDYEAPQATIKVTTGSMHQKSAVWLGGESNLKEYGLSSIAKLTDNKFHVYVAQTRSLSAQELLNLDFADKLLGDEKGMKWAQMRYFRKVDVNA